MKTEVRRFVVVAAVATFVGMPLLLYALDGVPRRTVLKEAISLATLLSFSLMLGQFFLARSNKTVLDLFSRQGIKAVHKAISLGAVAVILAHPFLIVVPRYFEAGVEPGDAFVTMLSTLESPGVVLGLIAWSLLLVIASTALFRKRLIRRLGVRYRSWRYFHGTLSVAFVGLAIWHAIELGRHVDRAMTTYFVTVALLGVLLLARLYLSQVSGGPAPAAATRGAKT